MHRLGCEKRANIADFEPVIEPLCSRLLDHGRRQIDPGQMRDVLAKYRADETGAAAEIEHRGKVHRPAAGPAHGFDRLVQDRRTSIVQVFGQRGVVTPGILVEQPTHIGLGHGRGGVAGPKPGELKPRAMIILGIGVTGTGERGDGSAPVAETVADGAEREPPRRKLGHKLDGLGKNIRGARESRRERHDRAPTCSAGRRSDRRKKRRAGRCPSSCARVPENNTYL